MVTRSKCNPNQNNTSYNASFLINDLKCRQANDVPKPIPFWHYQPPNSQKRIIHYNYKNGVSKTSVYGTEKDSQMTALLVAGVYMINLFQQNHFPNCGILPCLNCIEIHPCTDQLACSISPIPAYRFITSFLITID